MNSDNDWNETLENHPIFSPPEPLKSPTTTTTEVELSSNTLPRFVKADSVDDGPTPSGRRQTMVLKDADLIVAIGKEIRMTSLDDANSTEKSYKTLHTPNIQFDIHQVVLNPSGKLLAVAGAFEVAVIVLPRTGFMRLVPEMIDCKSVQIGQFYHTLQTSAPIAKIDWHPWGDAASTLLVLTADGKLREYDISVDTDEPQQLLSFLPERKSKALSAESEFTREVVSFSLGKGRADWGPLTLYALTKSGDIYALCPYLPRNASVPSSYIHSLECFISAKQEFLSQVDPSTRRDLAIIYDYHQKYVSALLRQLPPGTVYPATSHFTSIHPPTSIKMLPIRQGPFLLQPEPRLLEGSEEEAATDIAYLSFGSDDDDEGEGSPIRHLGIVIIAYQDGRIDLLLDVDKVEARWNLKGISGQNLPMLAVYETIDLGLFSALRSDGCPDLLQANYPVFFLDPIHDDTIYVYHAFGVHALQIGSLLQQFAVALQGANDDAVFESALQTLAETSVHSLLTTFSVERKSSNPIIGICLPNDVYLNYSILILSSSMRISISPLILRSDSSHELGSEPITSSNLLTKQGSLEKDIWLISAGGPPPPFSSMLALEPYHVPSIFAESGLPSMPQHALPASKELILTPEVIRYMATSAQHISSNIRDIKLSARAAQRRMQLQKEEMASLIRAAKAMIDKVEKLKVQRKEETHTRLRQIRDTQKELMARLNRLLQALMREVSPELSKHEMEWFEELKKMRAEIVGFGNYDSESLEVRTKQLVKEFSRIMPSLKVLAEREMQMKGRTATVNGGLRFSQVFEFGQRSSIERAQIEHLEQELAKLAIQVNANIGKPPRSK